MATFFSVSGFLGRPPYRPRSGHRQTRLGSFPDQLLLELCQFLEDVGDELATRRRRVDLSERLLKPISFLLKEGHQLNEIGQ